MAAAAATIFLSAQSQDTRVVNSVNFIGNQTFSHRKLLDQVQLKPSSLLIFSRVEFDRRLLKLDAISLKNFYHSNGFLEVAVKDSFAVNEDETDIFFIIREGKQYYLNSVTIEGLHSLKEKKLFHYWVWRMVILTIRSKSIQTWLSWMRNSRR